MNKIVLECKGLSKKYHDGTSTVTVLQGADLTVNQSEMIAVVGNSGSGKSTLLHLLGGLDKPTSGQVFLQGKELSKLAEKAKCRMRNQHLGFVYQFHHLLPEFTALENVGMPLLVGGMHPKEIEEKSMHLLKQVGLEKRVHHKIGELSGGERQRVAIARALVTDPLCVLADEPTGNLDPKNAERVFELFVNLQKKSKTSVVIVTHDYKLAQQAQRIYSINDGKLVQA